MHSSTARDIFDPWGSNKPYTVNRILNGSAPKHQELQEQRIKNPVFEDDSGSDRCSGVRLGTYTFDSDNNVASFGVFGGIKSTKKTHQGRRYNNLPRHLTDFEDDGRSDKSSDTVPSKSSLIVDRSCHRPKRVVSFAPEITDNEGGIRTVQPRIQRRGKAAKKPKTKRLSTKRTRKTSKDDMRPVGSKNKHIIYGKTVKVGQRNNYGGVCMEENTKDPNSNVTELWSSYETSVPLERRGTSLTDDEKARRGQRTPNKLGHFTPLPRPDDQVLQQAVQDDVKIQLVREIIDPYEVKIKVDRWCTRRHHTVGDDEAASADGLPNVKNSTTGPIKSTNTLDDYKPIYVPRREKVHLLRLPTHTKSPTSQGKPRYRSRSMRRSSSTRRSRNNSLSPTRHHETETDENTLYRSKSLPRYLDQQENSIQRGFTFRHRCKLDGNDTSRQGSRNESSPAPGTNSPSHYVPVHRTDSITSHGYFKDTDVTPQSTCSNDNVASMQVLANSTQHVPHTMATSVVSDMGRYKSQVGSRSQLEDTHSNVLTDHTTRNIQRARRISQCKKVCCICWFVVALVVTLAGAIATFLYFWGSS